MEEEKENSLDLAPLQELLQYDQPSASGMSKFGFESNISVIEHPGGKDNSLNKFSNQAGVSENPSSSSQSLTKMQEKREKGRIRSKLSREKRKAYVAKLESRIDDLETENSRLQNIIIKLHSEKYSKADPNSKSFVNDIQDLQGTTIDNFWNRDTMQHNSERSIAVGINYYNVASKAMEKHKKFLDSVFEMIINHPYSLTRFRYWKDLNSEYTTEYDQIKKLKKVDKYKVGEFMQANNLTPLDQYVASFNPSKRQFEFLKNVVFKKELQVKNEFKEAIKKLLEAKLIIQKANLEIHTFIGFFLNCGILSDEQILQSNIKYGFFKREQAFKNIWNVQVRLNRYCIDMAEDPLYGKYARKYLKKDKRILYFQYNDYSLP
ncbi:unnamed protein product [Moneuplotes crassus]|uniref:BZIP domain-containing protein n=1 Tax=Euplotes crassus TaxID=5936 RepID=A0AAD1XHY7_EUPCR|nr:unnamed protein product [Moneuplotes crassus]